MHASLLVAAVLAALLAPYQREGHVPQPALVAQDEDKESAVIVLLVLDEDGEPIERAQATIKLTEAEKAEAKTKSLPGSLSTRQWTDASGEVVLKVPPGQARTLTIQSATSYESSETLAVVALKPGEVHEAEVRLRTKDDRVLYGIILDDESGEPIAGASVWSSPTSNGFMVGRAAPLRPRAPAAAVTDASGRFEVSAATWRRSEVLVMKDGFSPAVLFAGKNAPFGSAATPHPFRLREGATVMVDLVDVPDGADLIAEFYTTSLTMAGGGIVGDFNCMRRVSVAAESLEGSDKRVIRDLPAVGDINLLLYQGRGELLRKPVGRLLPGKLSKVLIELTPSGVIGGVVLDAAGTPVGGQPVWIVPSRSGRVSWIHGFESDAVKVVTNQKGRFRAPGLIYRPYVVGFPPRDKVDWPGPLEQLASPRVITVSHGDKEVMVEIKMEVGRLICGTLLGPDGQATGGTIHYRSLSNHRSGRVSIEDPKAGFSLGPFLSGQYEITGRPLSTEWVTGSLPAKVAAGGEPIVLALRAAGNISGTIIDSATGEPLACAIYLIDPARPFSRTYTSMEARSTFEFNRLPAGKVYLVAEVDGQISSGAIEVDVVAGQAIEDMVVPVGKLATLNIDLGDPALVKSVRAYNGPRSVRVRFDHEGEGSVSVSVVRGRHRVQFTMRDGSILETTVEVESGASADVRLADATRRDG